MSIILSLIANKERICGILVSFSDHRGWGDMIPCIKIIPTKFLVEYLGIGRLLSTNN